MPWSATPQPRRLTAWIRPRLAGRAAVSSSSAETIVMVTPQRESGGRGRPSSLGRRGQSIGCATAKSVDLQQPGDARIGVKRLRYVLRAWSPYSSHRSGLSSMSARMSIRALDVGGREERTVDSLGHQLGEGPVGRRHRSSPGGHGLDRHHAEGLLPLRGNDHRPGAGQDAGHLGARDVTSHRDGGVSGRPAAPPPRTSHRRRPRPGAAATGTPGPEAIPRPHQERCALGLVKPPHISDLGLGGDLGVKRRWGHEVVLDEAAVGRQPERGEQVPLRSRDEDVGRDHGPPCGGVQPRAEHDRGGRGA